jgi:aspartyl-tRNA(Asn)/glutamyl-tRNA(Gln) amidotransferase subunit A
MEASVDAFHKTNGTTNAIVEFNVDLALTQADAFDAQRCDGGRGSNNMHILGGVPISIKDNFLLRGHFTTAGSRMLRDFASPDDDATVCAKIRGSGGVPCAKTNMDEFGMGSATSTGMHGAVASPVTADDRTVLTPGGSSGGAAAAVRAGVVCGAVGSDTGGSVRQPASFCGLVGLKPSYGALSRYGLISYASSMDCPGVITNSVADASVMFDALSGACGRDSTSLKGDSQCAPTFSHLLAHVRGDSSDVNTHRSTAAATGGDGGGGGGFTTVSALEEWQSLVDAAAGAALLGSLKGTVVGIPSEVMVTEMDASVRIRMQEAVNALQDAGAQVVPVSIPSLRLALPCYYVLACAEASSNLLRYDGLRYGHRADLTDVMRPGVGDTDTAGMTRLHSEIAASRGQAFGREVVRRLLTGTYVLSEGARGEFYDTACDVRGAIIRDFAAALQGVDVLLGPTVAKVSEA